MTRHNEHNSGAETSGSASGSLSLEFDATEFAHFLCETDWSDGEKAEYITLIWNIVLEFAAMGFNIHPVQQAQDGCGQPAKNQTEPVFSEAEMVNFSHGDLIEKFVRSNGVETVSGEGGVQDE